MELRNLWTAGPNASENTDISKKTKHAWPLSDYFVKTYNKIAYMVWYNLVSLMSFGGS
jgi:hypothetical protein